MPDPQRARARALAQAALDAGRPTEWFETLYQEAGHGKAIVPWDDRVPNPLLVRWLDAHPELVAHPPGARALDVGSGTGDNAAELARRGFEVVGCDVAPTAVALARERFGEVAEFRVLDVRALPLEWRGRFALVAEIYTLQVLPPWERAAAARAIADAVAPGGALVIISRARGDEEPPGDMPWPLLRGELEALADGALALESLDDVMDDETPPVRRFVATFRRRS